MADYVKFSLATGRGDRCFYAVCEYRYKWCTAKTRFFGLHFTLTMCHCIFNHLLPRYIMECRRGLAMRILFVCPSVKRVICDKWKKDRSRFSYHIRRSFSLVFWEEWLVVGATRSTWNFWSTGPHWSEIADFNRYSPVAPQPYHLAKKVQLTLIGSPLRAFQWAQDEHRALWLMASVYNLNNKLR